MAERPRFEDIVSGAIYEDTPTAPAPVYETPKSRIQPGRFSNILETALADPEPAPAAAAPPTDSLGQTLALPEGVEDIDDTRVVSEPEDADFYAATAGDLPELAGAPELSEFNMPAFATSMGLLTASDDQIADVISAQYPDAKVRRDDAGNTIVKMPSGLYVANRPGFSVADTTKFIADAAGFFPAGRVAGFWGGVAADAATDAALQGATIAASRGEASPDVAQAAANIGFSGALRGLDKFVSGLGKDVIPDAEKVVEAGEALDFPVVTTDINPPQTRFGLSRQAVRESIPVLGTGGARGAQDAAAKASPQKLLDAFGISDDLNAGDFEAAIVRDLVDFNKGEFARARQLRDQALENLSRDAPVQFYDTVAKGFEILESQNRLREMGDAGLRRTVRNVIDTLTPDQGITDIDQAIEIRSSLINDLRSAKAKAKSQEPGSAPKIAAALTELKKAFDKDIETFLKEQGGDEAVGLWNQSNKIFNTQLQTSRRTALRRVLNEGDVTPETVMTVLRQAKPSDLKRLHANLSEKGRANVRAAILRDAFSKGIDRGEVNPTALTKALDNTKMKALEDVFFTGPERQLMDGYKRLVKITERAVRGQQTTGQMTGPNVAIRALHNVIGGLAGLAESVTPIAALSKMYESRPVRNALIGISKLRPDDPKTLDLLEDLSLALRVGTLAATRSSEEQ